MSRIFAQPLLPDTFSEITVDLFAGGGGASIGFEMATGRPVDIAINHDAAATAMHAANHPNTEHHVSDVFEVDPRVATAGRKVGFLWASPDCTYHSKARGGKPIRSKNKKRRALAWVVTRWAGQVRPRVIMLENVEEFANWGPLIGPPDKLRPCPRRRGRSFRKWVKSLTDLGYAVEWRELRACDYGAPTIRKRLFLIARCDDKPIEWPEATHGPGKKHAYRTAASCIDWDIPMLSIFATREEAKAWGKLLGQAPPIRPLAENTMRRIARGVKRYVLDNPNPFLVNVANSKTTGRGPNVWDADEPMRTVTSSNGFGVAAPMIAPVTHEGERRTPTADEPLPTITAARRGELGLVAPIMVPRYGERLGQEPRSRSVEEPAPSIVPDGNGGSLVASFLGQYNGGFAEGNSGDGHELTDPASTISTKGPHQAVVTAFLDTHNNGFENRVGRSVDEPKSTICAEGCQQSVVAANMVQSNFGDKPFSGADEPLRTIVAGGTHHGVVATHIQRDFGQSVGSAADQPIGTITADRNGHAALVASFIAKYYGTSIGQDLNEPAHTIPTLDRFGLVTAKTDKARQLAALVGKHGYDGIEVEFWKPITVEIAGQTHVIEDIAMRMLQPRELYRAQGFPDSYIIDRCADGKPLTKTEQVRMCGNSVSPPVAAALIKANCPELIARKELRTA